MGVTVEAADGRTWTVRRRLRWPRWRGFGDVWGAADLAWWAPDDFAVGGLIAGLVLVALVAAFIFLLLPLVLFLLEAVLVLLGVLVLRAIWIVEASTIGPPAEKRAWKVRGWGRSRHAVEEVASELRSGVDAAPAAGESVEV